MSYDMAPLDLHQDSTPTTMPPPDTGRTLRERLEELVEAGYLDLPILPTVAAEVVALTSNDDCDIKKLADIVRRDQAMAGHMLRMANSATHRAVTQVASLQQAMARLGMQLVRQFAFVISCQNRVFRVRGREEQLRKLFAHSLATALYAQEIARARRSNVEESFLAGLLHDVGRPVLLQAITDFTTDVAFTEPEVEEAVSALHAYVGGDLSRQWGLSERLGEAIAHHHNPAAAPGNREGALTVRLADDLAHRLDGPGEGMDEVDMHQHPALAPLNLYPEDVDRLLAMGEKIAAQIEEMK